MLILPMFVFFQFTTGNRQKQNNHYSGLKLNSRYPSLCTSYYSLAYLSCRMSRSSPKFSRRHRVSSHITGKASLPRLPGFLYCKPLSTVISNQTLFTGIYCVHILDRLHTVLYPYLVHSGITHQGDSNNTPRIRLHYQRGGQGCGVSMSKNSMSYWHDMKTT
jgi:hypothetical protein